MSTRLQSNEERFDDEVTPAGEPSHEEIKTWRATHASFLLGSHPTLLDVFSVIQRVADTDCSVLITGESGTGKELAARALHTASLRRNEPFVSINCAAIPENLLESELFGHVRGAFTGATANRQGRFQLADRGTLLLDEIGEMPTSLQAKLLRVLQDKEVIPVGASRPQRVDVRIVAATNRDLEQLAATGQFREDLLYRLNVIPVEMPPLRQRRTDIPELAAHFVEVANQRHNRHIGRIEPQAMGALLAYDWPGNIRELSNVIERAVVIRSSGNLGLDDIPSKITRIAAAAPMDAPVLPEDGICLRDAVEQFENALILQALKRTGWNKSRAAAILQMNRTTLVEKLRKRSDEPGAGPDSHFAQAS